MTFTATGRNVDQTIAVRVSDEQAILMHGLRSTFPEAKWSHAVRWLLDQPQVRQVIADRVRQNGDEPVRNA